jgi:hypothetical protein
MEKLLKQAKQNYPKGTLFLSATGKIKSPLKVTKLNISKSEDLLEEIWLLEEKILSLWNESNPKHLKFSFKHVPKDFEQKERAKLEDLKSTKLDIVEEEGGVIYNGLTDVWATVVN